MKTIATLVLAGLLAGTAGAAAKDAQGLPTKQPKLQDRGRPAAEFVAKPTAAQLKAAKPAVNKLCPVSHEKVGTMGAPPLVIWKGQAYALCCEGCVQEFAKDPAKYAAEAAKEAK